MGDPFWMDPSGMWDHSNRSDTWTCKVFVKRWHQRLRTVELRWAWRDRYSFICPHQAMEQGCKRAIVYASDTDILMLGVYHSPLIDDVTELWIQKPDVYITCHWISDFLSRRYSNSTCAAILSILTGCDRVNNIFNINNILGLSTIYAVSYFKQRNQTSDHCHRPVMHFITTCWGPCIRSDHTVTATANRVWQNNWEGVTAFDEDEQTVQT